MSKHVQNKVHNSQIKLEQFTDQTIKVRNTLQLELNFS